MRYFILLFCLGYLPAISQISLQRELEINLPDRIGQFRGIHLDREGKVWLSTDRELILYKGRESIVKFRSEAIISAVYFSDSNLYLGLENGSLMRFSTMGSEERSFVQLTDSASISTIQIFQKDLIVGTSGEGLFILSESDTINLAKDSKKIQDNHIHSILAKDSTLFISNDFGVEIFDQNYSKIDEFHQALVWDLAFLDGSGLCYFAYGGKLGVSGEEISTNLIDGRKMIGKNGRLYIMHRYGISLYDEGELSLLAPGKGLIDFILLEEEALLTINKEGEIRYYDLLFDKLGISDLDLPPISSLVPGDDLYFSSANKIYQYSYADRSTKVLLNLSEKSTVSELAVFDEQLYIGTFNEGLISYNLKNGSATAYDESHGFTDNNVLSMDMWNDTLWLATLGGFSYFTRDGSIGVVSKAEAIGSTYIYAVRALDDRVLLGTDGEGLFCYKGGKIQKVDLKLDIQNPIIYGLAKSEEAFLFSEKRSGLYKYQFQERELTHYRFPSLEGYGSISYGGDGILLGQINTEIAIAKDSSLLRFNESLGIENLRGDYLNSAATDQSGKIFFAAGNEIYGFISPKGALPIPRIALEKVLVNFEESNRLEFSHDENNLQVELIPLWYRDLKGISIRYKLNGFDENFRSGKNFSLVYPNLPPGTYDLELEIGYNEIFYGPPKQVLSFTINSPFYFRWWFILGLITLISGSVYILVNMRIRRIEHLRSAEKKLIETELVSLRNQVNPHFLFNSFNTLMNIIESAPEQAPEYLQKLSDFYRRMLEDHRDQTIRLAEEIETAEEYLYLQNQRFDNAIRLNLSINPNDRDTPIPVLTLQLLVENVIKHNTILSSDPIDIYIESDTKELVVSNKVTRKDSRTFGMGIGLQNINSRYKALFRKNIIVLQENGLFIVKLPIIHE